MPSTKQTGARPPPPQSRAPPTQALRSVLDGIAHGRYKRVVVMAGAGISTAAGIPDFRSPQTGLYDNLQRLNLPYPEAVFDIAYLRRRPEAFFLLAEEMYPTQFQPTAFHRLVKWISDQGALRRVYTQNIDTLERLAGVPGDKIVEAHGSFAAAHCIDCHAEADKAEVEALILQKTGAIPRCHRCGGIVKPDIVFFGEALPQRFFELQDADFENVDLAIVAGSSLQVSPFNMLPEMVPRGVPRVLLNLERVGSLGSRPRDVLVLGRLEALDPLFEEYVGAPAKDAETEGVEGAETEGAVAKEAAKGPKKPAAKEPREPKEPVDDGDAQAKAAALSGLLSRMGHAKQQPEVEAKEPKELKEAKEPKEPREPADDEDAKAKAAALSGLLSRMGHAKKPDTAEAQESKELKDSKEPKEPKEAKQSKEPREPKEPKEPREPKEPKEPREPADDEDAKAKAAALSGLLSSMGHGKQPGAADAPEQKKEAPQHTGEPAGDEPSEEQVSAVASLLTRLGLAKDRP